eukprot:gnl/TRDRNA2_/TRDRNA2_152883_c0_seq1.p1 gnl/TRDRNA2_/TRDRNA2_152883_c0~~gnl/TRDRNA2_/TRDRNA2_152883_c0_seq1.p1  ORF type:complete len:161 (-),score=22.89 gnl/TRDRNA2_/TRDRNA2_152883_c0_seq1:55-477(-)
MTSNPSAPTPLRECGASLVPGAAASSPPSGWGGGDSLLPCGTPLPAAAGASNGISTPPPSGMTRLSTSTSANIPAGPAESWSIEQVVQYIDALGLSHFSGGFMGNAIDGAMLCELSEEDLISELGLDKLQAQKVLQRFPR